ncbi:MAG: class I SAM-dependent methyltransferase [Bryobacteraceae bacterium]|nr:class I SAM-dependent methyltransferase [Bryobacteraceae bacterium]
MTYETDLAYIHNAGFSSYSLNIAPGVLSLLRRHNASDGIVVDIGCGSGILARQLGFGGYDVLGFDPAKAMLELARRNAPAATFKQSGLFDAAIPPCAAVLCLGEVISYAAAQTPNHTIALKAALKRIHKALVPGGFCLLDYGKAGRNPAGMPRQGHWTGEDWAVLLNVEPSAKNSVILNRRLTTFRKVGKQGYRRGEELHCLRVFTDTEINTLLEAAGFADIRILRNIGDLRLASGHSAAIATRTGSA